MSDIFAGILDDLRGAVGSVGEFFDRGSSLISGGPISATDEAELLKSGWNRSSIGSGLSGKIGKAGMAALASASGGTATMNTYGLDPMIREANSRSNAQLSNSQEPLTHATDFEAYERNWMNRMYQFARLAEESKVTPK